MGYYCETLLLRWGSLPYLGRLGSAVVVISCLVAVVFFQSISLGNIFSIRFHVNVALLLYVLQSTNSSAVASMPFDFVIQSLFPSVISVDLVKSGASSSSVSELLLCSMSLCSYGGYLTPSGVVVLSESSLVS